MPLLGQRIAISQRDEIRMMRMWLQDHHEMVPDTLGHMAMPGMAMGDMLMPGMMTPPQMAALAAAKGPAFDRLFLEGMIRHHQGALVMVKHLFGTNGAAQTSEIFRFASDVDADQRAEIKRMQALLDAMPAPGPSGKLGEFSDSTPQHAHRNTHTASGTVSVLPPPCKQREI